MLLLYCLYTPGTSYELQANACIATFATFGVRLEGVPLTNCHNWLRNCIARPKLLLEKANEHPTDVIGTVDADMRCLKEPRRLLEFDGDIGCHDGGGINPDTRYCAGLVLFGTSERGRNLLRRWTELCERDERGAQGHSMRDQRYLHDCIQEAFDKDQEYFKKRRKMPDDALRFTNLGADYNTVTGQMDSTVIVHLIASRKLRTEIGGSF